MSMSLVMSVSHMAVSKMPAKMPVRLVSRTPMSLVWTLLVLLLAIHVKADVAPVNCSVGGTTVTCGPCQRCSIFAGKGCYNLCSECQSCHGGKCVFDKPGYCRLGTKCYKAGHLLLRKVKGPWRCWLVPCVIIRVVKFRVNQA